MPLCDGTGPLGLGPRTGRGKGRCCTGFNYKSISYSVLSRKYGWLLGLVLPPGTVILRNLLNPSGVIRRVGNGDISSAEERKMFHENSSCQR